ncbi:platelet-activating factor acetylhydrolase-like [Lepidochelys kempii]|uniref:platelet-activating factor acetylhydrolase-like n=1 Tax=Lepidochelys kempii TaxID=8472 RepID=UPI003C6EE971
MAEEKDMAEIKTFVTVQNTKEREKDMSSNCQIRCLVPALEPGSSGGIFGFRKVEGSDGTHFSLVLGGKPSALGCAECIKALDLILDIISGKHVVNVLPLNFDWTVLKGSIDSDRIAVMGHSFGAATAIEALSKEARFKCGIGLDAWMLPLDQTTALGDEVYAKVHQPLFINSEKFQWASNVLKMKKLYSTGTERKMIAIKGSVHQSFPDFTFLVGTFVGKIFKLKGEIDPNIAIDISNKTSLAFLQKHLGLEKGFDQWDALVDGDGHNVIPGINIDLPSTRPESLE